MCSRSTASGERRRGASCCLVLPSRGMGIANSGHFDSFYLVANNTRHIRLAAYAMISTMSGR
jgi:hypothetical protein